MSINQAVADEYDIRRERLLTNPEALTPEERQHISFTRLRVVYTEPDRDAIRIMRAFRELGFIISPVPCDHEDGYDDTMEVSFDYAQPKQGPFPPRKLVGPSAAETYLATHRETVDGAYRRLFGN